MYLIDQTTHPYFKSLMAMVNYELKDSVLTTNYSRRDGTWILNYMSFKNGNHKGITDYIAINTENLLFKKSKEYKEFLSKAIKVLDYTDNFKIGYSDYWRIEAEEAKEIDILFYGEVNDRRRKIFDEIEEETGKRITIIKDYVPYLWNYIHRSKIVLSVHHYSPSNNDMARIAPLLSNRVFVIAEECSEFKADNYSLVAFRKRKDIAKSCKFFLDYPINRIFYQDNGFDWIVNNRKYDSAI